MAIFGLLDFTLAAATYRLAFDISVIAAFTCAAGSKLYIFIRPLSTAMTALLELDIITNMKPQWKCGEAGMDHDSAPKPRRQTVVDRPGGSGAHGLRRTHGERSDAS